MDILENLFKKGSGFWKQKRRKIESARESGFEENFLTLELLGRSACAGFSLELRAVDGKGYAQGEILALPTSISRFSSKELNGFVHFHKALVGGAMRALMGSESRDVDPARCLIFLSDQFPAFEGWHHNGRNALREELGKNNETDLQEWLFLELRPPVFQKLVHAPAQSKRGRNQQPTEREAKRPGDIESVDLESEKKKQNPVMHSFEKLETADEYRGGHRITEASDQLDEHANALDELNLNKVTRSGDNAKSIYRAEVSDLFSSEESALSQERSASFLSYPEWDYKIRELKPLHCRLYISCPKPAADGDEWKRKLQEKYSSELLQWEQRWFGIMNQRAWKNRQWDGEELDVDAYVRYLADLRSSGQGDNRVFARRQPGKRDISTLVLLDQSFSTDSYVEGRRVLDVELESIGLSGLLLDKLGSPMAVAGTWSETRSHCYFQSYKNFRDPWDFFFDHAPQIEPQGYTRLGPAIRHSTTLLSQSGTRTKLLVLLTDGKPTDFDRYEGRYGMEDIYHSILEARQRGVEVKALAIEKDAKRYFPELFGPRNYQILPSPAQLPETLFRLYLEACKL